ncbi:MULTISPECIES: YdeI family protein [Chryseobacterium]|uniref:YdeI/OmpD-associated family protein n=1 Tax=Chryseobacterium TaxID=59732 RepID=UPI0016251F6C|nr:MULTISPECIES: YdeI/OmpD-associated family protein [Chryseobacterium]MDM1555999.1 YdeI/OmpD-associated family protein [Chryseobacterium indologenes]
METGLEKKSIAINTKQEWRNWLAQHHRSSQSIWLICNNKKSGLPTVSWSELVDEAICFGWIDSTRKTVDSRSFMQLYTKRKAKSNWSKINKEKVQRLIDTGLMQPAGFESIKVAKENGSWTSLDSVEELIIPNDLENAFAAHTGSKEYFLAMSKTLKKMMLHWVTFAKRPETRQKRINELVEHAAKKQKPEQFR